MPNVISQLDSTNDTSRNLIEIISDGQSYRVGVTDEELNVINGAVDAKTKYDNIVSDWGTETSGGRLNQIINATKNANDKAKNADDAKKKAEAAANVITSTSITRDSSGKVTKGLLAHYNENLNKWSFEERKIQSLNAAILNAINSLNISVGARRDDTNVIDFYATIPIVSYNNENNTWVINDSDKRQVGCFSSNTAMIANNSMYDSENKLVGYIYDGENHKSPYYCCHVISDFNGTEEDQENPFKLPAYGAITNNSKRMMSIVRSNSNGGACTKATSIFSFDILNAAKIINSKCYGYNYTQSVGTAGTDTIYSNIEDKFFTQQDISNELRMVHKTDEKTKEITNTVTVTLPSRNITSSGKGNINIFGFEAYIYYIAGDSYYIILNYDDLNNIENDRPNIRFGIINTIETLSEEDLNKTYTAENVSQVIDVRVNEKTNQSKYKVDLQHSDESGRTFKHYLVFLGFVGDEHRYTTTVPIGKIIDGDSLDLKMKTKKYTFKVRYNFPSVDLTTARAGIVKTTLSNISKSKAYEYGLSRTYVSGKTNTEENTNYKVKLSENTDAENFNVGEINVLKYEKSSNSEYTYLVYPNANGFKVSESTNSNNICSVTLEPYIKKIIFKIKTSKSSITTAVWFHSYPNIDATSYNNDATNRLTLTKYSEGFSLDGGYFPCKINGSTAKYDVEYNGNQLIRFTIDGTPTIISYPTVFSNVTINEETVLDTNANYNAQVVTIEATLA